MPAILHTFLFVAFLLIKGCLASEIIMVDGNYTDNETQEKKFETEPSAVKSTTVAIPTRKQLTVRPKLVGTITPSDCSVKGITKLEDLVYILCVTPQSKSILVYTDQYPFDLLLLILIEEIESPSSITSSLSSRCLYVSDTKANCIWKVDTDDHSVTKFLPKPEVISTAKFWRLQFISVTGDGHVIISNKSSNSLEIYAPDGALVRKVALSRTCGSPRSFVEKTAGKYIVILKQRRSLGITVVANNGTKTSRYNCSGEKKVVSHNMALNGDMLFISDEVGNRVVLYDANRLEWSGVVLSKKEHGIYKPTVLHYDSDRHQLIVAQLNGKLKLYEFDD